MHAWFDVSAGVAGDMLMGSLLDAGADLAAVSAAVDAVVPGAVTITTESVRRAGQRATKAHVALRIGDETHRRWASIRQMLHTADLHEQTRARALAAFGRLAEAEARCHGIAADEVHFHEVGALDAIADVVGVCEALRTLGVTSASGSPVALGSGRIRAAHGDIPVPAPAVAELAIGWRTVPVAPAGAAHTHPHGDPDTRDHSHDHEHHHTHSHGHDVHEGPAHVTTPGEAGELATPTGLALLRTWATACEPLPAMTLSAVGVGAGGKDFPGRPNVVRVLLGEPAASDAAPDETRLIELAANVDDQDPRLWPGVIDACLAAGAVDAWLVPIQMKKGRPAFTLRALAGAGVRDAVIDVLLTHTTTLGVREHPVSRTVLDRHSVGVDVLGQPVRVKVGSRAGVVVHATAEFADVANAARALGRPEYDVAQRAQAAAAASGLVPGQPVADGARG